MDIFGLDICEGSRDVKLSEVEVEVEEPRRRLRRKRHVDTDRDASPMFVDSRYTLDVPSNVATTETISPAVVLGAEEASSSKSTLVDKDPHTPSLLEERSIIGLVNLDQENHEVTRNYDFCHRNFAFRRVSFVADSP
ncbi:hypothetical protein ACFE04_011394 [Oxalis oulophora]